MSAASSEPDITRGEAVTFAIGLPLAFGVVVAPPWLRGGGFLLSVIGIVAVLGAGVVAWNRLREAGASQGGWRWRRFWWVLAICLAASGIAVTGGDVVAAHTIGDPPRLVRATSASTSCNGRLCSGTVTFASGEGQLTTAYPISAFDGDAASGRFAVDPSHPAHVMPEKAFRMGRGGLRWWFAASLFLTVGVVLAGAWIDRRQHLE